MAGSVTGIDTSVSPRTPVATDRVGKRDWPRLAPILLGVAATIYLVTLALASSRFTFWVPEDWLLFSQRADPTLQALFAPINGHWSTLPTLATEAMLRIFGLWYPAYLALVGLVHIVVVGLVYVLLESEIGPWLAGLAALLVLFLSSASEALFGFISIAFLLSMAFGLAALVVGRAREWRPLRAIAVWGLLLAALMSSGVGLVMVIVAAIAQIPRRRALLPASAIVLYVAWATLWPSAYGYPPRASVIEYVEHVVYRVGSAFVGTGPPVVGFLLIVALGVAVGVARGWRPGALTIAAGAGIAALYLAVGYRAGWEPRFADPGRYIYPAVVLALLAAAPALARAPVLAAGLLLVAIAVNVAGFPHAIDNWAAQSDVFRKNATAAIEGRSDSPKIEPLGPSVAAYRTTVARWGSP
jgi:hypothetical protein